MNHAYRFYPLPRPSLKTDRSKSSYCSCNVPCSGDACQGYSEYSSRNSSNYSAAAAAAAAANNTSNEPCPPQPPSPHVHFLGLYQTYLVDYDYDRSSTVVMPNECALPARGCPGRTYFNTQVANVARAGRRLARCATPGASRANSRSRSNMSPPPSPSFYAKHIFYPDEYPFPSPIPSPRVAAPPLVPDTGMTPAASDESDQGLATPPELASTSPSPPSLSRRSTNGYHHHHHPSASSAGSQLFIDAPGHPPIPGLLMSPRGIGGMGDMFAITNALNGLDVSSPSSSDGPAGWANPTSSPTTPTKKLKPKKSKSSLPASPDGKTSKRARVPAAVSFRACEGALGGF